MNSLCFMRYGNGRNAERCTEQRKQVWWDPCAGNNKRQNTTGAKPIPRSLEILTTLSYRHVLSWDYAKWSKRQGRSVWSNTIKRQLGVEWVREWVGESNGSNTTTVNSLIQTEGSLLHWCKNPYLFQCNGPSVGPLKCLIHQGRSLSISTTAPFSCRVWLVVMPRTDGNRMPTETKAARQTDVITFCRFFTIGLFWCRPLPDWFATSQSVQSTVSLVSREPSFCCGGRTVRINMPLESAWSTKLKFITFDRNRGQLDELR